MIALARRWLTQGAEAEDLVQEACLRGLTGMPPMGDADRRVWLATVLRRLCIDFLRRQQRQRTALARMACEPLDPADPVWPERLAEQAQRVEAALAHLAGTLKPEDAAAVLLHEVFELGHAELGPLTGRNEVASRQHLHRLLRRLRATPQTPLAGDPAREDTADLLALCRHALLQRDPAGLIALLRASAPQALAVRASAHAAPAMDEAAARQPRTQLLQAQGMSVLVVYMDGRYLTLLPLGETTPALA
ncbi:MAG: sigma-70 family RNA polymerase sigma factor [Pseudoxanthomonas sp.]